MQVFGYIFAGGLVLLFGWIIIKNTISLVRSIKEKKLKDKKDDSDI